MFERASGVLMHITSLPSPHGIGTMGREAYRFVDFLHEAGQRYWQVLPLGQTGYGDSPYQCYSTAAGNAYLIDLDLLHEEGLLTAAQVEAADVDDSLDAVDFTRIAETRMRALRHAFAALDEEQELEVNAFRHANADWVEDYALFMSLREMYNNKPLWEWQDEDIKARKPAALAEVKQELADEINFRVFIQYIFFKQWTALRKYANEKGVQIIGDIPIYVSPDSVDVWVNPRLFKVDETLLAKKIAGVPPDYYSETGQLWGNPVYDWKVHEKDGFRWWIWRMERVAALFDVVRIDHFRGFESYWEVNQGEKTAIGGKWVKGPGMKLFRAIEAALGQFPIIAEDLGIITDKVRRLLKTSGYPGMRVMIFGMFANQDNIHLPHNYEPNSIVYTSTHDSETICEQILDICKPKDAEFIKAYIRWDEREPLAWSAIRTLHASPANVAMVAMQDLLNLGADARMNTPSTLGCNWKWRVRPEAINSEVAAFLKSVTVINKRYHPLPGEEPEEEEPEETTETAAAETAESAPAVKETPESED
ncbi:MAG: 4-alpha-glucanotransferase [Butyricicoccus sp.]|nr:4-alpha-glucanotransferase [Butyricicoccus sp.]